MKKFKSFFVSVLLSILAVTAQASTLELKVSTGSPQGTYSQMFKQFAAVCGEGEVSLTEINSSGSVQNLDRLLGNEVNGAIVQTDALFYRSRNEDMSQIKTLFALHPEEVHVIATAQSKVVAGGITNKVMGKKVEFATVNDLDGQVVVAWGGSVITAQVIRLQGEIAYRVVEVANFNEAKAALDSGQAAAIIMVGGHPMTDVAKLDRSYKLLPFTDHLLAKLKDVYVPAKLTYSNLGQAGSGVPVIATEALLVSRNYRSPKQVTALKSVRGCFEEKAYEIAEELGTHKKWQAVNPENRGKWMVFGQ